MKKYVKIIVPIICIVIVVVTFGLLFNMKSKVAKTSNENIVDNTNSIEENEIEENSIQNEVTNEVIEEENTTVVENTVSNEINSSDEDRYSENRQEKAIQLVKEHWGEDDTVYFTNESVKSDEEYIVAVRLKSSTAVTNYFKVNINTGKVEIYY
jgi:FtsZ-interacting cell division protein ZipA